MKIQSSCSKIILGITHSIQVVGSEISRRIYGLLRLINRASKASFFQLSSLVGRIIGIKKSDSSSRIAQVQMKVLGSNLNTNKLAEETEEERVIRGEQIALAAETGDLIGLKMLLSKGPVLKDFLEISLIDAAKNGHLEIVKVLIEKEEISDADYQAAVFESAEKGYEQIVELLLEKRKISEDFAGDLIFKAADKGCLKIVQAVVKHFKEAFLNKDSPLHEYCSSAVFCLAGHSDSVDIIRLILQHSPLLEDYRAKSIAEAVKGNVLEVLKLLVFPVDSVLPVVRENAVCLASKKGCLETIKILLVDYFISDHCWTKAVFYAIEHGHLEVVQYLFDIKMPIAGFQATFLCSAIKNKDLNILEFFLKSVPVCKSIHELMIEFAEENGCIDAENMLKGYLEIKMDISNLSVESH